MLRCFRPDKLTAGLRHFVIQALGEKFVEPPTFNLGACFAGKFCSASLMPLLPELSFVNSSPTLPWSQLCTSFHLASADSSSTSPLYSPPSSPCLCRLLQHLTSVLPPLLPLPLQTPPAPHLCFSCCQPGRTPRPLYSSSPQITARPGPSFKSSPWARGKGPRQRRSSRTREPWAPGCCCR